jgi:hypothetical protein
MLSIFLAAVLLPFVFHACGENPTGAITIISVNPDSLLIDGNPYDFVVEVEYTLSGSSQGELRVGFNTAGVDIYTIDASETVIVGEGSGQHTFNSTNITAKDWSGGDFKARVYISEYPHGAVWLPLDSDAMALTF